MADLSLLHEKVSLVADGVDSSRIRPTDWNAEHPLAGGTEDGEVLHWRDSSPTKAAFSPLIPAGTRMLFDQDVAPAGWERDVESALNDRFIRSVSGSRTPNGGSHTISGLSTSNDGAHAHNGVTDPDTLTGPLSNDGPAGPTPSRLGHAHDFETDTQGAHEHVIGSDGNWRPAHRDVILCVKQSYS